MAKENSQICDSTSPLPPPSFPRLVPALSSLWSVRSVLGTLGHVLGEVDMTVSQTVPCLWNTHPFTPVGGQTSDREKFYEKKNNHLGNAQ